MKYTMSILAILSLLFLHLNQAHAGINVVISSESNNIKIITKRLTSSQLFALAIYGETRGENEEGKIGICLGG